MIRDHIGLLNLAQHEAGTPEAIAVYDQKEGTQDTGGTNLAASNPFLSNPWWPTFPLPEPCASCAANAPSKKTELTTTESRYYLSSAPSGQSIPAVGLN
jgi:hypothetical protein